MARKRQDLTTIAQTKSRQGSVQSSPEGEVYLTDRVQTGFKPKSTQSSDAGEVCFLSGLCGFALGAMAGIIIAPNYSFENPGFIFGAGIVGGVLGTITSGLIYYYSNRRSANNQAVRGQ